MIDRNRPELPPLFRWGLLLFLVLACVATATPADAGTTDDPPADVLGSAGPQLDVRSLRAVSSAGDLVVEIVLAQAVVAPDDDAPAALRGFVDLDVDRSAETGDLPVTTFLTGVDSGLGEEALLDLSTWTAGDGAADLRVGATVVRVPVEIEGSTVRARIPSSALGSSGPVHLAAVVGTREEWTDIAPNGGFLRSTDVGDELILGGRFRVDVTWRNFEGQTGVGRVAVRSEDSAVLWFFGEANWELLLKVLDGCALNDRFWVLFSATTNVEYTLSITDVVTGAVRSWTNPLGTAAAAVTDTEAFEGCAP